MKSLFPLFIFCLILQTVFAQKSERQVLALTSSQIQTSAWQALPLKADPFLAFSVTWESTASQELYYRFANETEIQNWQLLHRDEHATAAWAVSELIFTDADWTQVQIKANAPEALSELKLHFYSPGRSELSTNQSITSKTLADCSCITPSYLDRDGWCPTGDCTPHPSPSFTEVTHLIVHHAASTNASSDWAGVVRSIWDFHVNSNGWDDVGYNWLIDPNGVVYEGRGNDIQGAHFCSRNTGTAGICMLGNFNTAEASAQAVESLIELLSWKACDKDIDPTATTLHATSNLNLPTIAGHRDGCSTECPGDLFYPTFSVIRGAVSAYIEGACNITSLPATDSSLGQLDVFPNPSTSENTSLQVNLSGAYRGDFQIKLYQASSAKLQGAWQFTKDGPQWSTALATTALAPGLYILEVESPNGRQHFKIIRE